MYMNLLQKTILTLLILIVFTFPVSVLYANIENKNPEDELIVIGNRKDRTEVKKRKTSFIREIYFDDYLGRTKDLVEILNDLPGLHVKKFGGYGSYSSISIRGSSANQVSILIDGIPLNSAQTGSVNLGDIPLENFEKIEIYYGNLPVEFNTSPIGGVVNLITKKAKSTRGYLKISSGSFETYSANAYGSYSNQFFNILGIFSGFQSKANFEFLDDNGTEFNDKDDEITKRNNNQIDEYNFFFKSGLNISDRVNLQLSNNFYKKNQGLPGIGSIQTENTEVRTTRNILNLIFNWNEFMNPMIDFSSNCFYSYQSQRFIDLDGEFGFGLSSTEDLTDVYGQNIIFRIYPSEIIEIITSAGFKKERFKPWDQLSEPNRESIQKRLEKYISSSFELHFLNHKLILQGSIKYNQYKNYFNNSDTGYLITKDNQDTSIKEDFFSPSQGFLFKPFEFLTFKGNIGKYHRIPNFIELFGNKGSVFGNPDLTPERSDNWDLGFLIDLGKPDFIDYLTIEYSFFENKVKDLIQFEMFTSTMSKAFNTDSARITGHEISLDFSIFKHIRFSGNFTKLKAVNTTQDKTLEGNFLPFRPEKEAFGRLTAYFEKFSIFFETEFVQQIYLNPANNDSVPERTVFNSGFSIKPWEYIEFAFEVKNFTDNRIFDMRNYPLPGISYHLSLILSFE